MVFALDAENVIGKEAEAVSKSAETSITEPEGATHGRIMIKDFAVHITV